MTSKSKLSRPARCGCRWITARTVIAIAAMKEKNSPTAPPLGGVVVLGRGGDAVGLAGEGHGGGDKSLGFSAQ